MDPPSPKRQWGQGDADGAKGQRVKAEHAMPAGTDPIRWLAGKTGRGLQQPEAERGEKVDLAKLFSQGVLRTQAESPQPRNSPQASASAPSADSRVSPQPTSPK
eukprot:Sspe_Gene.68723::Locus_40517_Transcript_1_1_Confidence_1.000_Length_465::g.68723::m.68723